MVRSGRSSQRGASSGASFKQNLTSTGYQIDCRARPTRTPKHSPTMPAYAVSTIEDPTATTEGQRFSYTPALGVFHAMTGVHGDILIPEDRLKAAVVKAALGDTTLVAEVDKLLGKPWDDELETFRHAGEGAPVRWLHQVV